jgi:inorganic pyrophosphatase
MSYANVTAGKNPPDEVHAIIEISANGLPVKYEIDKEQDVLMVDRFLSTSMVYPCNYGYIPRTLSEDGDPLDILVLTPNALVAGAVIRCRPIGLLKMSDEAGIDTKILAVPVAKLTHAYNGINTITDMPAQYLDMISHFFEQYKALESGKWVKVEGWRDAEEAKQEILKGIAAYLP